MVDINIIILWKTYFDFSIQTLAGYEQASAHILHIEKLHEIDGDKMPLLTESFLQVS